MLDTLFQEIILRIFSFLPPSDLRKLSLVSKTIKIFAEDEQLWNRLIAQNFAQGFNSSNINYKNIYFCFFKQNEKERKKMAADPFDYAIKNALQPKNFKAIIQEQELEVESMKRRKFNKS